MLNEFLLPLDYLVVTLVIVMCILFRAFVLPYCRRFNVQILHIRVALLPKRETFTSCDYSLG